MPVSVPPMKSKDIRPVADSVMLVKGLFIFFVPAAFVWKSEAAGREESVSCVLCEVPGKGSPERFS